MTRLAGLMGAALPAAAAAAVIPAGEARAVGLTLDLAAAPDAHGAVAAFAAAAVAAIVTADPTLAVRRAGALTHHALLIERALTAVTPAAILAAGDPFTLRDAATLTARAGALPIFTDKIGHTLTTDAPAAIVATAAPHALRLTGGVHEIRVEHDDDVSVLGVLSVHEIRVEHDDDAGVWIIRRRVFEHRGPPILGRVARRVGARVLIPPHVP